MFMNQQMSGPEWNQLTPVQKRELRLSRFINPVDIQFHNAEARQAYQIRAQRLADVYNLQEPDRVPLTLHLGTLPLQYYGLSYHTAMKDYPQAIEAYNRFNQAFAAGLESFATIAVLIPGQAFELLDYKMYAWPGHGLPENSGGYQFREQEYMKAGEYDDLIQNPADFWLRFYLPRIFGAMQCLQNTSPITDLIEIPTAQLMPLATQPVQDMLKILLRAGEDLAERNAIHKNLFTQGPASGFPPLVDFLCIAPFDIIGDTLRGTQGIMTDMYRRPDKLMEAMEILTRIQIKSTLNKAAGGRGLVVTFPLHKGADGWMSQSQFETFYWPFLKKTIDALVNEGLIVTLFAEGGYDTRLESVNEFPAGAIHWWFDKTDMARAKRILGNKCSIAGNVPSSLLMKGTPAQVKDYCRNLIAVCGKNGGYALAEGAADVEARIENLQAMAEAVREFGVYRR
ncbi:MAG TPA: uroporphyrinogen decarboxylase family protein [Dehalococcoidales bacterium]|nr:uroporphyrinogen decarboxylase family protein [Dehalococcoidales bacterium]